MYCTKYWRRRCHKFSLLSIAPLYLPIHTGIGVEHLKPLPCQPLILNVENKKLKIVLRQTKLKKSFCAQTVFSMNYRDFLHQFAPAKQDKVKKNSLVFDANTHELVNKVNCVTFLFSTIKSCVFCSLKRLCCYRDLTIYWNWLIS